MPPFPNKETIKLNKGVTRGTGRTSQAVRDPKFVLENRTQQLTEHKNILDNFKYFTIKFKKQLKF